MTPLPSKRNSSTSSLIIAVLAVALGSSAACKGGKGKASAGEASCDDAGKAFLAMAKKDLAAARDVPETTRAGLLQMLIPVRDEFVAKCLEEKWPAKARACLVAATTDEAYRACEAELPPEVRTRLGAGRPVTPPPSVENDLGAAPAEKTETNDGDLTPPVDGEAPVAVDPATPVPSPTPTP